MTPDGVVKYSCIHADGPAPVHPELAALGALRTDLVKAGLIGVLDNGVGYGNVSVRCGGSEFIVTATATGGIRELPPEGWCSVTGCDIDANTLWSTGPAKPSSESLTHAAVYGASSEARCVIHLHNRRLFEDLLAGGAPATDPSALYGTPAMARSVEALVKKRPADGIIVMTGHQDGFLMYAPGIDHMRDLLYMLGQGYVPA